VLSRVPQGSVLGPVIFNVFTIDFCSVAKVSNTLVFVDDVKIYGEINSPYDSWLLQSDINNIRVWCISNWMERNI